MNVGQLRKLLEPFSDEWAVIVEYPESSAHIATVWEQASDVVNGPGGTDPMTESTTGVVIIETDTTGDTTQQGPQVAA